MSFNRPSLSELIERARADIAARLPGADASLRHSVLDVLARTHAGATAGLYSYLDTVARQILPDTAEGEYLSRHAGIWGVRRKPAIAAAGTLTLTGINAAPIAAGTELQRSDGTRYRTTAAAVIAAGTAVVTFEAAEAGLAGSIDVAAQLTFTSPVPGVNALAAVASITAVGADEEADDALLARLLDRIQRPPQGGTANDYVQWALAQPGVTRAWSWGNWMGAGTVGLTFVMDGRVNILPEAADVAAVQSALDLLRPVTAELFVFAPVAQAIDFTIRALPDTPAARTAITAELADFFAREAEPGGTIWLSRIGEAISLAEGEFRHVIEAPGGDVTVSAGRLPVLGTVSFVS